MSAGPSARLAALDLELPPPFAPVGTYQPSVVSDNRLYIAGQGPVWGTDIRYRRRPCREVDLQEARAAARLTMLNVLSQVEHAIGLDRVNRALNLFGLVNAPPGYGDAHHVIAAGALVLEQVFGEAGRCTLSSIAATSLPFDIAVEMDAVFEIV